MSESVVTMEKLVALAKQRGFVYPGSAIYGGLANSWDFGPLGTELKNNLRDWWWEFFVHQRTDMVGIDAAIIMNPKVWESSGHTANFTDAMVDCRKCKARLRADHLIEEQVPEIKVEGLPPEQLTIIMQEHQVKCPTCGSTDLTEARTFNLLFETSIGKTEKDRSVVYLRGEIAQSMFVNFKQVLETTRSRLPFGIASLGKAFRNEITPGNFIYRTLEFDLMEFEYFIQETEWKSTFEYWLAQMQQWLASMGFAPDQLRVREHTPEELSFYSKRTLDIEYHTPFGWKELFGLAYRTDYDLGKHMESSGEDMRYTDPQTGEKIIPHVIEPTFGLSRLVLMALLNAYQEEETVSAKGEKETRVVMKFHPRLAPYKIAILPLSKKEELQAIAKPLQERLTKRWYTTYDETQSIGKRYRRQDEIGTPYCVTVDFDSLEDKAVTVRDRDSMKQVRIPIDDLESYFEETFNW
ncbi:MAG: Glycine-tRNA ligase [Candidatus Uhrbacteria bacterium GW2011_GWE2_40_58]|nr:MAG: Glycine-tRNA ligase [Candidatus Uhrbacteria bacterium GW2011_GWF2_40_263]KKR67348.1 MAG: Glycine-tRNA ligase [Candidatus Uhrbacteria bacterium GW2011_GWE2_40_58]OGL93542.1 MAG: glycine--tRNA ligase [Candidatus Uhrbacteria bacterium RIFOXYA2_FULL_40_9]OGL96648.1 MAG: glycine--tRNA ligase [Candidatus Uhrbacteria bacterium RIFOXYB2_FULL_41_18]HBK34726.1 glycine--tRNA ligase [Candidatus Uhrbacteria bacterium]